MSDFKYKYLIVDTNNLYFRNFFTHKDLSIQNNNEEIKTGGIYGFLQSVAKLMKLYLAENGEIYFVADNFASKDHQRKQLDPNYKLNRVKYEDAFYKGLDYLFLILLNYSNNFYLIQVPTCEADDIVPAVTKGFSKYDKCLVVSNDLDYARCIDVNTHWLSGNDIYTQESFKQKYNFIPSSNKVTLYKTIRGDHSDNIPIGVKGIREDTILKLIEDYSDIYDLMKNINTIEYLDQKWRDEFIKNKSRLILNFQLVSFIDIDQDELKEHIRKGNYNPTILRSFYKQLGFKISDIDKRLCSEFPKPEDLKKDESFFKPPTLPRK